MIKNKIQLIYAQRTLEIFNRQSALGSYINCFSKILRKNGYNVKINELFSLENTPSNEIANSGPSALKRSIPLFVKEFLKDIRLFINLKRQFKAIDKQSDFDVVLEFYTYGSDVGFQFSKKYKRPMILVYDSPVLEANQYFNKGQIFFKRIIQKREEKTLFAAESIIVYSNAVKIYLEKKYHRSFPIFIHQNVDFTRFEFINIKPELEVINIGFLGSFLKWHRVDLLLEAFTRLKENGVNCKLFLLGNGEEFSKIKESVRLNKYNTSIEIPGFLDGTDLLELKKKIHIGVMPGSNWYGAPNKIFEYGASRMAVVGPDTPTIKELFIEEKEILLFKSDSTEALYLCLKRLCDNKDLLNQLAVTLQEKIKETYSENKTFDFYNHLITNSI